MGYSFWIILLAATSLSVSMDSCTKEAGCVPSDSIKVDSPPSGPTVYIPSTPLRLSCEVFTPSKLKDIHWIRNNSDGDSVTLNSTSDGFSFLNIESKNLEDSPAEDKFPYTYQCVAIGKCCEVIISPPKTVTLGQPTTPPSTAPTLLSTAVSRKKELSILQIKREPDEFNGYGKLQLECTGLGDNTTTVEWIKSDKDGNNVTLNRTSLDFHTTTITIWQAILLEKPGNLSKFPYQYQCVVKNRCCETKMKQVEVAYIPINGCPFALFGGPFKHMEVNPVASKRSVKFTWVYDPDPEDTGFRFTVINKTPTKQFNITEREYIVHGLVPSTTYLYNYQILYGDSCNTANTLSSFKTLPDVPSEPRNVSLEVAFNTIEVSWIRPEFPSGEDLRYIVFWKRSDTNEDNKQANVSERQFVIENLDEFKSYTIEVQSVNEIGRSNRSAPVSVVTRQDPNKHNKVNTIHSSTSVYTGFGKVHVLCTGKGNNESNIHWIRTDKDGNNEVTLNTTTFKLIDESDWQAELHDKPNVTKFPFKYKCVAKNKCCPEDISEEQLITYTEGKNCTNSTPYKPIEMNSIPSKRSVKLSWKYDADPEDTGFNIEVIGVAVARMINITTSEYTFDGLDPFKRYEYRYGVSYATDCETQSELRFFTTLPDYPGTPENITVQIVNGNSLNVSWLPPKQPNGVIESYTVYWKKADDDNYMKKNVKSNFYLIEDLEDLGSYSVKVEAINSVGSGNNSVVVPVHLVSPEPDDDGSSAGAIAGAVIGTILFVLLLLMLIFFARKKVLRNQHKKSVRQFGLSRLEVNMGVVPSEEDNPRTEAEPLPAKAVSDIDVDFTEDLSYIVLLEDWEIAPDKLKLLDKKLGGGQFGVVWQGLLTTGKDDPEIVAVKTLKDGASESDLSDLKSELIILKEVNKTSHPNVIKLIGGCSIAGKLHVITEFCPGGSLRHVLLNSRVYPTEENSANYINLASTLNHRQLLKIAADISSGMVHLSSQQFVHRDLAARNILIGVDNMAKVSDFGLARDVSGAEEYIRNNQNLLPVKWMALESLLYGRFTTASDVWSYGVLLHEITTLGDEPYQNISPYNIVSHVGSGCRMSQPPQCSDEVYAIMTKCWQVEPTARPTFEEIHELLRGMLMDNEKSYINVTQIIDEGSVSEATEPKSLSVKDGAVRYTATTHS